MKISPKIRETVEERAEGLCEYCRCTQDFSPQPFVLEHIIPKSKNGTDDLENLAFACSACNNSKYDKTKGRDPVTRQPVMLFHPRKHKWEKHFMWNKDCTELIGLTKIARATIDTLKLNRERIVRIRKALYLLGKHPPK
jgi:hypothetical protein